MRLLKQLLGVFAVLVVLAAGLLLFTQDVLKLEWVSFMEIQPSYSKMEEPLPLPERSVPVQGVAYLLDEAGQPIPPENPIPADEESVARGAIFYQYNCVMCHGEQGDGRGALSAFLITQKPADLTSALVQDQTDGQIFLTLTNGKGFMPYMRENLTVRDRWDVVNFVRTLQAAE